MRGRGGWEDGNEDRRGWGISAKPHFSSESYIPTEPQVLTAGAPYSVNRACPRREVNPRLLILTVLVISSLPFNHWNSQGEESRQWDVATVGFWPLFPSLELLNGALSLMIRVETMSRCMDGWGRYPTHHTNHRHSKAHRRDTPCKVQTPAYKASVQHNCHYTEQVMMIVRSVSALGKSARQGYTILSTKRYSC